MIFLLFIKIALKNDFLSCAPIPMDPIRCPLSHSTRCEITETIPVSRLREIQKQLLPAYAFPELDNTESIALVHCADSDLRFFHPAIEGAEGFYKQLQAFDWYYTKDKNEFSIASSYIKPTDAVLEVGAGDGNFATRINCGSYCGLELNQEAIAEASRKNISLLFETVEQHAQHNVAKYDVVCAFQVLEHIRDINSFVDHCLQCLKPGGLLLFSVPSYESFYTLSSNQRLNLPPHHCSWWSDKALQSLATQFGIGVVDIHHETADPLHMQLIAHSVALTSINAFLGKKLKVVDTSLGYRLRSKLAGLLGKFLKPGIAHPHYQLRGMSVTAVYKK